MTDGSAGTLPAGQFAGRTELSHNARQVRFVETSYQAGAVLGRHAHDRAHLCFVLEGAYTETVDSATGHRAAYSLGFLPEHCPHDESHRTFGRHFIVEIAPELAEELSDRQTPPHAAVLDGSAVLLAARLYAQFRSAPDAEALSADLVHELLAKCYAPLYLDRPAWVQRAREIIREKYQGTVRLGTLAADAGVHPVHLAQTFRRVYGRSVGQFLRQVRVEHACRELTAGRLPISEIAYGSGFADQSHLSRCFKRVIGVTPRRYRRLTAPGQTPKGVQDLV